MTCRKAGSVSASPTVKAMGAVGTPASVAWSAMALMVGGLLAGPGSTVSAKRAVALSSPSETWTAISISPWSKG